MKETKIIESNNNALKFFNKKTHLFINGTSVIWYIHVVLAMQQFRGEQLHVVGLLLGNAIQIQRDGVVRWSSS